MMPDADRLEEILRQVTDARENADVCIEHDGMELRRFRGQLYIVQPRPVPARDLYLRWQGETRWVIDKLAGTLVFSETMGSGVAASRLQGAEVFVRLRQGGERLRLAANRPAQTLKNLLQATELPPWERERLPLLYIGKRLVWVPGVGIEADFQAASGAAGISPLWLSNVADALR
jgi:tRNA(Ile)-lysidine synthase